MREEQGNWAGAQRRLQRQPLGQPTCARGTLTRAVHPWLFTAWNSSAVTLNLRTAPGAQPRVPAQHALAQQVTAHGAEPQLITNLNRVTDGEKQKFYTSPSTRSKTAKNLVVMQRGHNNIRRLSSRFWLVTSTLNVKTVTCTIPYSRLPFPSNWFLHFIPKQTMTTN